ncbi:MAG: hypothetical protein IH897_04620 [Planctomycetes bacterium]|nr:hypothetical protein [Planctomycetota bacterium]
MSQKNGPKDERSRRPNRAGEVDELDEILRCFVESFPDPATDENVRRRGLEEIRRRARQKRRGDVNVG